MIPQGNSRNDSFYISSHTRLCRFDIDSTMIYHDKLCIGWGVRDILITNMENMLEWCANSKVYLLNSYEKNIFRNILLTSWTFCAGRASFATLRIECNQTFYLVITAVNFAPFLVLQQSLCDHNCRTHADSGKAMLAPLTAARSPRPQKRHFARQRRATANGAGEWVRA